MRYVVNATIEVDAWIYVEADNFEDALEKAHALHMSEFELGDLLAVNLGSVTLDD